MATNTLKECAIQVLETGHAGIGYDNSANAGSWPIEISGVRRYVHNTDGVIDTVLADDMSAKQTIFVIPDDVRRSPQEVQR